MPEYRAAAAGVWYDTSVSAMPKNSMSARNMKWFSPITSSPQTKAVAVRHLHHER